MFAEPLFMNNLQESIHADKDAEAPFGNIEDIMEPEECSYTRM